MNHAPDFISKYNIELAKKFYDKLSDYEPTPLLSLDSLAEELGLSKILVKDESKRFSLNSFAMQRKERSSVSTGPRDSRKG